MTILEKAYELGQEILASEEFADMKSAEQAMFEDEIAGSIMQEFAAKQKQYLELQEQGQQLTDVQRDEVDDLEKRMLGNTLIFSYFEAQQKFEKVLGEINSIIAQAIGGNDFCGDDCCSSCGDGCSN